MRRDEDPPTARNSWFSGVWWVFVLLLLSSPARGASERPPNVVLICVDTLRFDRLSLHGYPGPISPHIDRLLESGVYFTQARVPEPLTAPAMISVLSSLHPHEHGASRNGLAMRPDLPSLPRFLERRGYRRGAFVGNWTLKDKLTGLAEHFDDYREILTRRRWLGIFTREATAEDVNEEALQWIEEQVEDHPRRPFFVWVHYVEPHAPYRFHREYAERLGIDRAGGASPEERYDTEVAHVDAAIGRFLERLGELSPPSKTLIVFLSDHGESLGEHGYWGHGRNLHEPGLRVPMGIAWPGRLEPGRVDVPASALDLTPTVLGLLGMPVPKALRGHDWSAQIRGEAEMPEGRITYHQAHKGAVRGGGRQARRRGLLEVGMLQGESKELWRIKGQDTRSLFDLEADPGELDNRVEPRSGLSAELAAWLEEVEAGLAASDELPPPSLDEESLEQLEALGYLD